jgi:hypothetical protein
VAYAAPELLDRIHGRGGLGICTRPRKIRQVAGKAVDTGIAMKVAAPVRRDTRKATAVRIGRL